MAIFRIETQIVKDEDKIKIRRDKELRDYYEREFQEFKVNYDVIQRIDQVKEIDLTREEWNIIKHAMPNYNIGVQDLKIIIWNMMLYISEDPKDGRVSPRDCVAKIIEKNDKIIIMGTKYNDEKDNIEYDDIDEILVDMIKQFVYFERKFYEPVLCPLNRMDNEPISKSLIR